MDVTQLTNQGLLKTPKLRTQEKLPTWVYGSARSAIAAAADKVAQIIRAKNESGSPCVLGLGVDYSLSGLYDELSRKHKEEGLSFKNVHTFQTQEYYPMTPYMRDQQSHQTWLKSYLLSHVDIPEENMHFFNCEVKAKEVDAHLIEYGDTIAKYGGIDLLLISASGGGRIAFVEPSSPSNKNLLAAIVELEQKTRIAAASDFFGVDHVPTHGLTLTLDSLLAAKAVIFMAFSEGKADTVVQIVEAEAKPTYPASALQRHKNIVVVTDEAAGANLVRFRCPWTMGGQAGAIEYNEHMERKAVIWLAITCEKSILRLTDEDYTSHHLLQLLKERGPAYDINIRVFSHMRDTITGWPGGKKDGPTTGNVSDFPKRVIVFSPHPDDDVISMGGTLIRLVDQGHDVHVCYQTSGNIAVWDDYARQFAHFVSQYAKLFDLPSEAMAKIQEIENTVEGFIAHKQPAQVDPPEVQKIKGLIRQTEAREAARYAGVNPKNIHNLHLPFYETGKVKKNPLSQADVDLVKNLLETVQPQQIYCAGDLSDPHGTHRVCLNAVVEALKQSEQTEWYKNCEVWLYRGAWQEWEPENIQMAVPLSPQELMKKRLAIFKHQSQKDLAPFPGTDKREFWQRTEARNRATAQLYDALGLQEYEAIEAFVMFSENLNI